MYVNTNTFLTATRFRLLIQISFTLFYLYIGLRFAAFISWAVGSTDVFTPKPPSVEGFLPISALLGFRHLLSTGQWDTIHPAGLSIFIAILLMSFLFRKGFCSYLCPIGFLSSLLERAGRKINMAIIPHKWIDLPLISLKYLLLGGFLFVIFSMDTKSLEAFIFGSYNLASDARMLLFFTIPSKLTLAIICILFLLNVAIRNFWCRYLCPYGALLGLLAWIGPSSIRRDRTTCINCGKCTKTCPSGINIQEKIVVVSPECIGCGECIGVCPVDDCLSFSIYGKKHISLITIGIGCVSTLLLIWLWANATGHWNNEIPHNMLRKIYSTIPIYAPPSLLICLARL